MIFPKPITLKEVANLINAEFEGPENFVLTGINEIHVVEPGDITFVDHPKYYDKALSSKASAIIINQKVKCPEGKVLIFHDDPFYAFNTITTTYNKFKPSNKHISDTAVIGKNTIIQPGVFIGNNVSIGENCIIHSNVSIYDNSVIGNDVIIHSNTVIGADAFYFQFKNGKHRKLESCGRVIIGDGVEIGSNCSIDKGVTGDTIIGENTKLDNLIQVGHDTRIGKSCIIASQVGIAGCVTIEDNVILWGQVGVQKDLTIGKGAVVLGQSGIPKSLEGNKVYFGSPVQEAKDKMRELAYIKQLPEIIQRIKENNGK
ncbi:MAG: UDP-3-O-(3-hydroxymyristoyl)glucosamine N-acyltransferase [Marinilabiliales bacterium]